MSYTNVKYSKKSKRVSKKIPFAISLYEWSYFRMHSLFREDTKIKRSLEEFGGEFSRPEGCVVHQRYMKRYRCFYTFNDKFLQRALHPGDHFFAGLAGDDQFGDHGIVVWRNGVAGIYVTVNPYTVAARHMQVGDLSG